MPAPTIHVANSTRLLGVREIAALTNTPLHTVRQDLKRGNNRPNIFGLPAPDAVISSCYIWFYSTIADSRYGFEPLPKGEEIPAELQDRLLEK